MNLKSSNEEEIMEVAYSLSYNEELAIRNEMGLDRYNLYAAEYNLSSAEYFFDRVHHRKSAIAEQIHKMDLIKQNVLIAWNNFNL